MKMFISKRVAAACVAAIALGMCGMASAADAPGDITFTKDVLPIFQENCHTAKWRRHRP